MIIQLFESILVCVLHFVFFWNWKNRAERASRFEFRKKINNRQRFLNFNGRRKKEKNKEYWIEAKRSREQNRRSSTARTTLKPFYCSYSFNIIESSLCVLLFRSFLPFYCIDARTTQYYLPSLATTICLILYLYVLLYLYRLVCMSLWDVRRRNRITRSSDRPSSPCEK